MSVLEEMWPIFPLPSYSLGGHLGIFRRKNWTMFFKLSSMHAHSCLGCPLLTPNLKKNCKKNHWQGYFTTMQEFGKQI
jgi:hypothetical protein